MTELDERRARITVVLEEIRVTTLSLMARGVDPGHAADKREALAIVKSITEKAYQG